MKKERSGMIAVIVAVIAALMAFILLYQKERIPVETPETEITDSSLSDWTVEESEANGAPLKEDKSIYEGPDNNIYDVYLSVFPTKDSNGEMLDFSAFGKHVARDHTYNPVLNCNIQILDEGESLDPLLNLDDKNATIRVRGNSSRGDVYKSYKIKFNDNMKEFEGQTTLNLNKHVEDHSKITTKFCTDILQDMDNMVSYRTNFMRVWIRDTSLPKEEQKFEYYGLFTHIEQPNKKYLEARGLSSSCVMYKARDFSFQITDAMKNVDDPEYSQEEFELELGIREGDNHEKLLEMLEAVNDETNNFEDVLDTYFNEDNYLTWLAFNLLIGAEDILNHNFILYSPNNSKTWYFITWDYDSNMAKDGDFSLPASLKGGQKLNQVIFHRRYFKIPGNLEKLQKKMDELMKNNFSREHITELTNGYVDVLEKTMTLEPDVGLLRMEPDELIPYVQSFPDMVETKYQEFLTAFQYPAPMFVGMPSRNEDGSVHLSWDNSYSYQGRTITYNVQIANDCYMNNILYEEKGIVANETDAQVNLAPGTYYLKVTAVDSAGMEQLSLEHYEFSGEQFIYENGVLEFTIE